MGAPPRPAAPSSRAQSFPFQPPRGSSDSKTDLDTSAALHGGPAVTGALSVGSVHGRGSHWGKVPGLARPAALLPAAPPTLRIPARAAEIAPSCDRSATTGLGHLSRHSRDHGCFCLLLVVAFLPLRCVASWGHARKPLDPRAAPRGWSLAPDPQEEGGGAGAQRPPARPLSPLLPFLFFLSPLLSFMAFPLPLSALLRPWEQSHLPTDGLGEFMASLR